MAKLAKGTKFYWGDGGAGAAKATKSHGSGDSNVTFEAVSAGTSGNSITVALTNPGGTADLSVTVVDTAITIALGVSTGTIVSTANDVIAGVYKSTAARALVNASSTGDGTGLVTALVSTALSGGTNSAEVFYDIPGVGDISLNPGSYSQLDVSSHSSTGPQPEMLNEAFTSPGTASFSMYWDETNAGHLALEADYIANTARNAKIDPVAGGGKTRSFVAQVANIGESYPVKGAIMRDVTIQIQGNITLS